MAIYNGASGGNGDVRAGIASLEVNGEALDVMGDLAYDATRFKKEIRVGQSGIQGVQVMFKAGSISGTISDSGTMSVAQFMEMGPVAVNATLANGKRVYGDALNCTECSEVKTMEGTFTVKFEGLVMESST